MLRNSERPPRRSLLMTHGSSLSYERALRSPKKNGSFMKVRTCFSMLAKRFSSESRIASRSFMSPEKRKSFIFKSKNYWLRRSFYLGHRVFFRTSGGADSSDWPTLPPYGIFKVVYILG